jgi:hypothetical protein
VGEVTPRVTIPEVWADKGCCPFCQAASLRVRHAPDVADQLVCGRCGAAFELELSGARIRLMEAPASLKPSSAVYQAWGSVAEVRARLQSAASVAPRGAVASSSVPTAPAAPTAPSPGAELPSEPPLAASTANIISQPAPSSALESGPTAVPSVLAACDEAELSARAEGLLALGNSPLKIQAALVQSGVPAEQVQAVMESVRRVAHQKRQQQIRTAWVWSGVVIVFVVLAAGAGLWFTRGPASSTVSPFASVPPPTATGIVGLLLSQPTPVVQTEPPPAPGKAPARCPSAPIDAAVLFGGQAGDWTFKSDVNGWIMTSVTARNIHVPAGMEAGYFGIDAASGASMTQVVGPAAIERVNFVAITCP